MTRQEKIDDVRVIHDLIGTSIRKTEKAIAELKETLYFLIDIEKKAYSDLRKAIEEVE